MKTHTKVWLWLIFIVNILTAFSYLRMALRSPLYWAYVLSEVCLVVAAYLMLFQQKKLGFYIFCAIAFIVFFLNISQGVMIVFALLGAVLGPVITYLFMKSSWDCFS